MKDKLSTFLVNKRKIILAVFIGLAVAFACLIPFVNVNYDMSEYLPDDSSMKQGLDIMNAEFGEVESSTLQVMFNDLKTSSEKQDMKKQLADIRHVSDVEYEDDDEAYNKDEYTLYVISCEYDQYSDEAKSILDTVEDGIGEEHNIVTAGSIKSANESGLPIWIATIAVIMVFLIILIMASTWIEPLAMLITIGIAVMINMGSYIFFPSISNTTFGIVAILQLALSMDYSIMLMNRYRQQREGKEKLQAMKDSLSLSFGAISGSSLTTFAGLLALVFMSFTIGADIGISLAKGVVISLICIFTVLPALMLAFDNLMLKTAKRTLKFHYPRLSRLQYRFRIPITLLFVAIFVVVFFAKGNMEYSYSQEEQSEIDKVFGYSNSIVMIYNADDGAKAEKLADELEDDDAVVSATCYEGTIGKERTAVEMKDFIEDMAGSGYNMELDTDTIRLIYYDYHAGDRQLSLTIPEFVTFLKNDVVNNENFAGSMNADVSSKIDEMGKFTDRKMLTKKMNASGLAKFFGMKKSQAGQLLLYYEIKKGKAEPVKMTLPQFVNFIINDLASDKTYGKMIDSKTIKQLKNMAVYTDTDQMTAPVDYQTAATYLGMDSEAMLHVYQYYFAGTEQDPETATESVQNMLYFMVTDPAIRASISEEQIAQLETLSGIVNLSVSGVKMSYGEMADAMGMSKSDARSIFLLHDYKQGNTSKWRLSPQGFVNFIVSDVLTDKSMKKQIGNSANELLLAQKIINNVVAGTKFTATEMADLFSGYSSEMDSDTMKLLYELYGSKHDYNESWTMNMCTLVAHLDDNIAGNPAYSSLLEADQKKDISEMREELDEAAAQLEGEDYGRLIITADLPEDSTQTREFMDRLTSETEENFQNNCYFIGNTPMAYEMSKTFQSELNKITIITALFIFIIVLLTFRNLTAPVILVLIIQCAVYMTMGIMSIIHFDINYLALLIVQSLMMGATIDYGIIYTTYYIENREKLTAPDAIREAFRGSMQTILTSSTILIVAVGILSFAFSELATRQICRILSAGCLTATVLVIFVLPAMLACLDKLIIKKK